MNSTLFISRLFFFTFLAYLHFLYSDFRGFGFITFADPASVDKVLAHDHHELDGKKVTAFAVDSFLMTAVKILPELLTDYFFII